MQEDIITACTCKIQFYIILTLSILIWPRDFCSSTLKKLKAVQRTFVLKCNLNNAFISDVKCYVPIKLCKTAGSIHLFQITGMLVPEKVKLK